MRCSEIEPHSAFWAG